MWEIWANYLLLKAIKTCPKSNKLFNLVTLVATPIPWVYCFWISKLEKSNDFQGIKNKQFSGALLEKWNI